MHGNILIIALFVIGIGLLFITSRLPDRNELIPIFGILGLLLLAFGFVSCGYIMGMADGSLVKWLFSINT